MSTVAVSFSALPAHVRTARLIATAVARRAGVAEHLLDEVRLAVGEACSRAVGLHQTQRPAELVRLEMSDEQDRFTVVVRDGVQSTAAPETFDELNTEALAAPVDGEATSDPLPAGFGLAVISGLVDDLDVATGPSGTQVRMTWPAHDVMAPDLEGA